MTAPLTSTSFPRGAQADRSEAEARAQRANSLHSAIFGQFKGAPRTAYEEEVKAAGIVFSAVAECLSKLEDARLLTTIRRDDVQDLIQAIKDSVPSELQWDEAISNVRGE